MIRNIPQFLIAAPTSGTGKTTVSRLLMTLLTQKKLRVQPYKCGPDYIDTKHHAMAAGEESVNLDTYMKKLAEFRLTIWTFLWLPSIMYVRYIIIMQ